MWDLPGPGLEPVSPALAGGFLTTVPPREVLKIRFLSSTAVTKETNSTGHFYSHLPVLSGLRDLPQFLSQHKSNIITLVCPLCFTAQVSHYCPMSFGLKLEAFYLGI